MNRQILICAFFAAAAATLVAQQASQSNPYQGVSNPPPDDTIVTTTAPEAKPPAGHRAVQPQPAQKTQQQAAPQPAQETAPQPAEAAPQANSAYEAGVDGTDAGIVKVAPQTPAPAVRPALAERANAPDPDNDIVHPAPLPPGTLGAGTTIRVRLLNALSSSFSEQGEAFRSRVASDVYQGDHVLIPAGSEIDGTVAEASRGHFGGSGSLLLRPDVVILPNGERFKLHAMVTETPVSRTHVETEGVISPNPSLKRDGIEYGGGVGAGVVAGAYLGGPVGALAGGLIGAGLVTVHLLVSHPQAHLEEGDVLDLSLTEPMQLTVTGAEAQRN